MGGFAKLKNDLPKISVFNGFFCTDYTADKLHFTS
jgi:hypothetical protein